MATAPDRRAEYDPPDRLRQLPSWLAGQTARRAERLVAEGLAQEGMRRQHYTVLTSLAERGSSSQASLGRRLWIDPSDLHAILNDLEYEGFVARAPDERDHRRNLVILTPRGSSFLTRLDARVDAAQEAFLKPLSENQRRQLRTLLRRLAAGA